MLGRSGDLSSKHRPRGSSMHRLSTVLLSSLALLVTLADSAPGQQLPEAAWKAHSAAVIVTPDRPVWMAGYAARGDRMARCIDDPIPELS